MYTPKKVQLQVTAHYHDQTDGYTHANTILIMATRPVCTYVPYLNINDKNVP